MPATPTTVRTASPNRTRSPGPSTAGRPGACTTNPLGTADLGRGVQRFRGQIGHQHPPPHQVVEHRQHRKSIPDRPRAREQSPRAGENLQQPLRQLDPGTAAGMAIAREPAHVGPANRVRCADPREPPAHLSTPPRHRLESLGVGRLDPVVGADINHFTGAVAAAREEIRRMSTTTRLVRPVKPERLRWETRDVRVEIQQHGVIAFQPRLIADVAADVDDHHHPGQCRWDRDQRKSRTGPTSSNATVAPVDSDSRRPRPVSPT